MSVRYIIEVMFNSFIAKGDNSTRIITTRNSMDQITGVCAYRYRIIVEFEFEFEFELTRVRVQVRVPRWRSLSYAYMRYSYVRLHCISKARELVSCKPKEGGADHGSDVCAREQTTLVSQATPFSVRVCQACETGVVRIVQWCLSR